MLGCDVHAHLHLNEDRIQRHEARGGNEKEVRHKHLADPAFESVLKHLDETAIACKYASTSGEVHNEGSVV